MDETILFLLLDVFGPCQIQMLIVENSYGLAVSKKIRRPLLVDDNTCKLRHLEYSEALLLPP